MYSLAVIGSSLSNLSTIFKFIIIAIVYLIIFTAFRIMYKDMKNSGSRKAPKRGKSFGLEVVDPGMNRAIRKGAVIPINREVTIGRREDNSITLNEGYVSGHHARVYLRNNQYILEDLNSTNGTALNGQRVENKVYIKNGDEIKIGSSLFKVIG
ncbi:MULTISPECIES: FHA domain-containing protein [Clostridium]|uniref:FHA domain-containing protein n=1 Tax=Clostridium TaxID=1485 RepID=UPI0008246B2D|nr:MULTISPECIES: FHA domain-containing protein [Clostridium]